MALTATARTTYDAAVERFDTLSFWRRYGEATVGRLALPAGGRVLDLCAGTGSSAIAAARAVGTCGSVLAIDISAGMLEVAWQKAEREGLRNLTIHVADMTRLELEPASYDAVVIVFGLFFAADMIEQVRAMWRLVRPGGVLAITTWAEDLFEPLYTPFITEARRLGGDGEEFTPWQRLTTLSAMDDVLRGAGVEHFELVREAGEEPLARPEDWWAIVVGSGLRWFVDRLDPTDAAKLRDLSIANARDVRSIQSSVIYAVARKA